MDEIDLILDPVTQRVTVIDPSPTVSVLWDIAIQTAIIETSPGPTIGSRASATTHTAMFDAWATYDERAMPTQLSDDLQRPASDNTDENKAQAMSYAAYTVAVSLFPGQQQVFDDLMADLGFDPNVDPATLNPTGPTMIGLMAGEAVRDFRLADGSNQAGGYADTSNYQPVNTSPLAIVEIDLWTPENVPIDPEDDAPEQSFLTPHWGGVTTFGLADGAAARPVAPEPFFLVDGATLDVEAGTITLADASVVDVSPDLVGTIINPGFITQAQRVIDASAELTDEQKLIAEFWEDGGGTSFPPGTWMTFGQFVSARDDHTIDEDAAMFFALGNAVMDAGIATWEAKEFYDYTRPVRAIRELGELGLIGEEGTDELTGETGFVIDAWAGPGEGTRTILAENWLTYQTPGLDPSPPFAEYTSGHSAFSASAGLILAAFAAGEEFGADVTFQAGESRFEPGLVPAQELTLSWDTFADAADEGGISRIYGGIHFDDGDLNGRQLGRDVGRAVYTEAQRFITGTAGDEAPGTSSAPDAVVDVATLYQLMLGRYVDRGGLNFYDQFGDTADGLAAVAEAFIESPEYARTFGLRDLSSDEAFADQIVFNAGLDAETTDLDEAIEASLAGGASRAEAVAEIVDDPEVTGSLAYLNALEEVAPDDFWFA